MTTRSQIEPPRSTLDQMIRFVVDEHVGRHRRIVSWTRRRSAYSSSCPITKVRVQLEDETVFSFILKSLHPTNWLPTAREVRPFFLYNPAREIHVYREFLSELDLGTAAYLRSEADLEGHQVWLLLEHVPGPLLWQLGRERHWQSAARWLAHLHQLTHAPHRGVRCEESDVLLTYDEAHFGLWAERAERFVSGSKVPIARSTARNLGMVFDRYERVARSLSALPRSLVHGEFYPSNIIMRRVGGHHEVCPIDWELTGWGAGILDLAALSFGGWSPEQKQRLVRAYVEAIPPGHGLALAPRDMENAVDLAHLHLCIRQLGWANEWTPPAQHARDWPDDTVKLAGRLGLLRRNE